MGQGYFSARTPIAPRTESMLLMHPHGEGKGGRLELTTQRSPSPPAVLHPVHHPPPPRALVLHPPHTRPCHPCCAGMPNPKHLL